MIKIPIENKWTQPNNSDKFGSVWATKNINFDEEGYAKLSPRTVVLFDQAGNSGLGRPTFLGRISDGTYLIGSASRSFYMSATATSLTVTQDTNSPTFTTNSHSVFFQDRVYASTATDIQYRPLTGGAGATWTALSLSLTDGVRHYLEVFGSRQTLCVTDNNVVRQYSTAHAAGTALTIPADYEAIGLAYNNSKMGVITRLGGATEGQNAQARFFVWDGASTGASSDAAVGSDACVAVCAYKASFAILTRAGQLLYWNGGGFDVLASFPFYFDRNILGTILNNLTRGNSMVADGDIIYIHLPMDLGVTNRKNESTYPNMPSGVWCFDPKVGLYHRYSLSASKVYVNSVTEGNVNTTTDLFTITSGTIPATGNIARVTTMTTVGGLTLYNDYYIIKVSSTTFRLATTKEKALAGVYIDITSVSGTTVFWMYDLVDYGSSFYEEAGAGAVAPLGETSQFYTDIIVGGTTITTAGSSNNVICIGDPYLENRGHLLSPKIFSSQVEDFGQKFIVKHRPLKTTDSIIVKYRRKDVVGLPVSSSGTEANWTGDHEFYTSQDLSEAKTYLDSGGELELEILNGAGGNQTAQISSIGVSGTTYSVVVAETILGAGAGLQSEYIIHNWETLKTITSDSDGAVVIPVGKSSKFYQFKVELRGSDMVIEELQFVPNTSKQSA